MSALDIEKERRDFEDWMRSKYSAAILARAYGGAYIYKTARDLHACWIAAKRATQPAVAGGESEVIAAARKLVKAKGRYHTEQNYKALADALAKYDAAHVSGQGGEDARLAALREFINCLDGKREANEKGEPGFEFNDRIWANLEPARAAIAATQSTEQAHDAPLTGPKE